MKKDELTAIGHIKNNTARTNFLLFLIIVLVAMTNFKLDDIFKSIEMVRCEPKQEKDGNYRINYKCQLPKGYVPENKANFK